MQKANPLRAIIFIILVSGFTLGVIKLFLLRFEVGDVYPAYSTLRSDPVGNRAFYSSLTYINDALVSRNYHPLPNLEFKERTTLFYIGAPVFDSESVSTEWFKVFERLTHRGGRLVLSFFPIQKKPANWRMSKCFEPMEEDKKNLKGKQQDPQNGSKKLSTQNSNCVSLKEKWGLTFGFAEKPVDRAVNISNAPFQTRLNELPETISWHTALFFDDLEDAWRVIYAADERPVIIERPYGKGSLVLSADSFFLSNEALKKERYPELLVWIIGESATVVFDETHLGIYKHPGVLTLIKKYRFYGFIFTVAVLALLFIWKNSIYFVPPPKGSPSQPSQNVISDRDSTQGLISLLHRNIPARQILQICVRQWEGTFQPENRFQSDKLAQIKTAFQMIKSQSAKSIDPVAGYRRISKIISKGRHHE